MEATAARFWGAPAPQWDELGNYAMPCGFVAAGSTQPTKHLVLDVAESHAATVKHTVIAVEKAVGRIKRYLQLTSVMAAKQRTRAHTVTAKVAARRLPGCHANTAAKTVVNRARRDSIPALLAQCL